MIPARSLEEDLEGLRVLNATVMANQGKGGKGINNFAEIVKKLEERWASGEGQKRRLAWEAEQAKLEKSDSGKGGKQSGKHKWKPEPLKPPKSGA
jgi:hypothetical protein